MSRAIPGTPGPAGACALVVAAYASYEAISPPSALRGGADVTSASSGHCPLTVCYCWRPSCYSGVGRPRAAGFIVLHPGRRRRRLLSPSASPSHLPPTLLLRLGSAVNLCGRRPATGRAAACGRAVDSAID